MENKTNAGERVGSMLLDHFAMTIVAMIFYIPGMISGFSTGFEVTHEPSNQEMFGGLGFLGILGFALYFCKDSINGRSIAKRVLNLQVVENNNGTTASPLRCFVRNIFCILWPIEVIVTLASPSRRIGDFVAGTKVVPYESEVPQTKIEYQQVGLSFILACILMSLIFIPFWLLNSAIENQQVTYIESTLNQHASTATETLFADSLGDYLKADVRVYDNIEENDSLKYVSVILSLHQNYLKNDSDFEQIKSATVPLLLTEFQEKSFVGQIQYVYKEKGYFQAITLPLDWRTKD